MLRNINPEMFRKILISQQETCSELKIEQPKRRKERLKKIKNWILDNRRAIQQALYQDLHKSAQEADISEIYPMLTELRHAIAHLEEWASPTSIDGNFVFMGTSASIHYEPKGVCLIISPWNYPFSLALGPMISALAAGNTVIVKPSEFTPHTNSVIKKLIGDLFEERMVALVEGEADVAQELLKLPFDHIFFTGSPAVGKIVMKAASAHLTSVTLELGGKSPTVIDKSADLKDAAEKIAWGKWLNAGQTCVAPDYLFIHHTVSDAFLEILKEQVNRLYTTPDQYARIINSRHYDRLNKQVDEALRSGGTLALGGTPNDDRLQIPPTVLCGLSSDVTLMQEEIFGPVLPVLLYDELDEVIDFINTRPRPLALYFFTRSKANEKKMLKETSSGTVVINDAVLHFGHPNLPFGGVSNSGMGRAHGKAGFVAFSNEKSVLKQRVGYTVAKAIYPPYTAMKNKIIDFMLKYF